MIPHAEQAVGIPYADSALELLTLPDRIHLDVEILRGRFDHEEVLPRFAPVSLLDLEAGAGAFAAWARLKWATIKIVELTQTDERLRRMLAINVAPWSGTRIHAESPLDQIREAAKASPGIIECQFPIAYDVIHLAVPFATTYPIDWLEDLAIDFKAARVVVLEFHDTDGFTAGASFFGCDLGFTIVAADARSQVWVK